MRKLATYEGVVENGHVTLPPNADIPDHTRVYVLVPDADPKRIPRVGSPRFVHRADAKDFEKIVFEEIDDAGV